MVLLGLLLGVYSPWGLATSNRGNVLFYHTGCYRQQVGFSLFTFSGLDIAACIYVHRSGNARQYSLFCYFINFAQLLTTESLKYNKVSNLFSRPV